MTPSRMMVVAGREKSVGSHSGSGESSDDPDYLSLLVDATIFYQHWG
jgi:hypothetical protein